MLAEYSTIGSLFGQYLGSTPVPSIVVVGVLTMIYTTYGGLLISIYTDQIQGGWVGGWVGRSVGGWVAPDPVGELAGMAAWCSPTPRLASPHLCYCSTLLLQASPPCCSSPLHHHCHFTPPTPSPPSAGLASVLLFTATPTPPTPNSPHPHSPAAHAPHPTSTPSSCRRRLRAALHHHWHLRGGHLPPRQPAQAHALRPDGEPQRVLHLRGQRPGLVPDLRHERIALHRYRLLGWGDSRFDSGGVCARDPPAPLCFVVVVVVVCGEGLFTATISSGGWMGGWVRRPSGSTPGPPSTSPRPRAPTLGATPPPAPPPVQRPSGSAPGPPPPSMPCVWGPPSAASASPSSSSSQVGGEEAAFFFLSFSMLYFWPRHHPRRRLLRPCVYGGAASPLLPSALLFRFRFAQPISLPPPLPEPAPPPASAAPPAFWVQGSWGCWAPGAA